MVPHSLPEPDERDAQWGLAAWRGLLIFTSASTTDDVGERQTNEQGHSHVDNQRVAS